MKQQGHDRSALPSAITAEKEMLGMLERKKKIMGLATRIYSTSDPRNEIIKPDVRKTRLRTSANRAVSGCQCASKK